MCSDIVVDSTAAICPFPEVREMTAFANGSRFHECLQTAGFYLSTRNPIVQFELISGYLDSPPSKITASYHLNNQDTSTEDRNPEFYTKFSF